MNIISGFYSNCVQLAICSKICNYAIFMLSAMFVNFFGHTAKKAFKSTKKTDNNNTIIEKFVQHKIDEDPLMCKSKKGQS